MGILSNIFNKIFPSSHPAVTQASAPAATPAPAPAAAASATAAVPKVQNAPVPPVDVEAILAAMSASAGETLNWRTSIVDLLKLLKLDSSLQSRKELAQELAYTGDAGDSATMNLWLHRQVMSKLAANGGKVPAELKD